MRATANHELFSINGAKTVKYITTNDQTKLYIKDWGIGRPIILMHGWPLSSDSWDFQAMALADAGFRAIAYDRRGFGRSEQPFTGCDYDTLADDLAAVIEQTGAEDATIVGFSMGGGEVARYMSRHGGKHVVKAGLIASVVPFMLKTDDHPEGVDGSVFDGMKDGIREDRANFFESFFKNFYGVGMVSKPVSQEVLEWTRSLAMQASLKATLDCVTAFGTTDFRDDLAAFEVPTLIIHGSDDQTVPINISGHAAANGIASSIFSEYEGAPHGLNVTHQQRLADDLVAFAKKV